MLRAILCCLLLIISAPSSALAKLGHQLVCQLAFDHLSVDKQQKLTAILAELPAVHQRSINRYNYYKNDRKISFADACTWADAIKNELEFIKFKHWHFLNVPRDVVNLTEQSCTENCIIQAVRIHQQQLKHSKNLLEKTEALLFLSHWLGDIHQPLHVSFASDLGGNRRAITVPEGKCNNLHWLWDSCLLVSDLNGKLKSANTGNKARMGSRDKKANFTLILAKLNNQWQQAPIKKWQQDSVLQWANESLTLIRQPSFKYCQLTVNYICQPLSTEDIHLPQSYMLEYQPVLEQRLLQAAVRLTALLEQSL